MYSVMNILYFPFNVIDWSQISSIMYIFKEQVFNQGDYVIVILIIYLSIK